MNKRDSQKLFSDQPVRNLRGTRAERTSRKEQVQQSGGRRAAQGVWNMEHSI